MRRIVRMTIKSSGLLSELEEVRGPLGLPIERDLYFKPKMLEEIAPDMFRKEERK